MEILLKVDDFSCGYPGKFMIQDLGFQLKQGQLTGIIGPNGSGKTTLFKGISGELPTKMGKLTLGSKDLGKMSIRDKAKQLAIVSQHTETIDISVADYVLMGRLPYRKSLGFFETADDYEIAEKYMELTGTAKMRDKIFSQLSGGEQQLVAIARALTQEPSLLLLDEPTSHLDITAQAKVLNLIQELNTQLGLTVLMIVHDLNLASEYCDHLIMMNKGRLHATGEPNDVLTYQNIETVYQTVVITKTNPLSQKPAIFLVSDRTLKMHNSK